MIIIHADIGPIHSCHQTVSRTLRSVHRVEIGMQNQYQLFIIYENLPQLPLSSPCQLICLVL
jgi:hypothetical protein